MYLINIGSRYNIFVNFFYQDLSEYLSEFYHNLKSLDIRITTLPADHPSIAKSYNSNGLIYYDKSDFDKSLKNII